MNRPKMFLTTRYTASPPSREAKMPRREDSECLWERGHSNTCF